jgi:hypothetical protein
MILEWFWTLQNDSGVVLEGFWTLQSGFGGVLAPLEWFWKGSCIELYPHTKLDDVH